MNPDSLMARYWLERLRRERGEHTGLRALAPVLSGLVSECCSAKVTSNRLGDLVCIACRGVCEGKTWFAARAEAQRGDGVRTMYVQETRVMDRDREDRLRAREADRFLEYARLAELIEPRPPAIPAQRWQYTLHAYGGVLTLGPAETIRLGEASYANLGPWSERSIGRACDLARDVLSRRMIWRRAHERPVSHSDRRSCAI